MSVSLVCDGEGLIVEAVDAAGARYAWVEGVERLERIIAAWAEREAEGYTVAYEMGYGPIFGFDINCPVPVDGVALVSLWGPGGQRIQGMALDPLEWPGGPGAYTALVVSGSTSIGGAARWLERRREDAARALNAVADAVDAAGRSVGAAVGGALVATGDAVATLPTPREALNGIAEGVGEAAGTLVGAFGVAGARGTGAAVSALWEELPVAGKVVVVVAGALAVFIGARALGRALK